MGPENETPERTPQAEGDYSIVTPPEENTDSDAGPRAPYEFSIRVTQSDPELQVIEAVMTLLQLLPNDANRAGVLRYLNDRFDVVADARTTAPAPVSRDDVARVLALADGRDWWSVPVSQRSTYYRRADALHVDGMTVIRIQG